MLYGGPLGTYLSGLSSTSSTPLASSTGSSYTPSAYGSSNYLSSGLRRSNSRYRSNGAGPNLAPTSASAQSGSSLSSYYTPQLRRKYGTPENETPKTNRYSTSSRTQPRPSNSPTASTNSTSGHSGVFHYSRWSPNKSSGSGYTGSAIGTSASWNSDLNTASSSSVDYKRLYEAEKSATDELRVEIAAAQRELRELQEQIDVTQRKRRSSDAEQRKLERKISECDEELKTLDKLRSESERLRAEHRALVRVVSRLNREQ
ncbi:Protein phosphatase 1 regulatory subunit 12A [Fasciola gigantica]|uniref:Protein phosphatase 1 regulatory subunit 12A n=1 Tax=Fasciola gigantica TaxID=46835 RepID=A0A504Z8I1_FASGI|nr:Protein phosphatase 1 regulatory subunit 12A [Fasciola gigantica]